MNISNVELFDTIVKVTAQPNSIAIETAEGWNLVVDAPPANGSSYRDGTLLLPNDALEPGKEISITFQQASKGEVHNGVSTATLEPVWVAVGPGTALERRPPAYQGVELVVRHVDKSSKSPVAVVSIVRNAL